MQLRRISTAVVLAAWLAACGGKAEGPASTAGVGSAATLYDRLGKRDAIAAVVKDFVEERVAKDARINAHFTNSDIPGLEAKLVDQICEASGGPCKYTGKDMKTAHVGMHIRDADFDAMVEDLKASLDRFKVGEREQHDLLAALASMRGDIVGQ